MPEKVGSGELPGSTEPPARYRLPLALRLLVILLVAAGAVLTILDGVTSNGDIMDVGCANGYLLECLVRWGSERGLRLTPHGVDRSTPLVARARARLPEFSGNMPIGNARSWSPPKQYDYVYSLYDCVPPESLKEYIGRLMKLPATHSSPDCAVKNKFSLVFFFLD